MTLTPMGYRPRIVDKEIKDMLRLSGYVSIEGPKYCGKTWSGLNHAESVFALNDPKNSFGNKRLAETEPSLVMKGDYPRLIDEWQETPKIWDAVRFTVDHDKKSRFILTGSSTPDYSGIQHSGTGRVGRIKMRTMSLFESGDSSGKVSLSELMKGKIRECPMKDIDIVKIAELCVRGGWPESIGLDEQHSQMIARRYLDSLIRMDANMVDGVRRDSSKLMMLIRSLARNESTVVSNNTLIRDMKQFDGENASAITAMRYVDILSTLFILEEQRSFSPNVRSSIRIGKSPKRHLTDPSLDIAALSLSSEMLIEDLKTFGFIFESMCERDLDVYSRAIGGELMHYRDAKGNEVDSVIQMRDGSYGFFEIKLGMDQIDSAAKRITDVSDLMEKEGFGRPTVMCVICGNAMTAYRRKDGVIVVPITMLRE